jgi:dinuclear metal center YbgI/SA1388 family protein
VASVPTLATVVSILEEIFPPAGAEAWDRVGLVTGRLNQEVSSIRLVVDVVSDTVNEAVSDSVDLIVAHHPLLLRGVHSVAENDYKGALVSALIRNDTALYSAHTNADAVDLGTTETLATALGLTQLTPINEGLDSSSGIGRVGVLKKPTRLYDLATSLGALLPQCASGLRVSGDPESMVRSVALCTGAGDSLLGHTAVRDADVYITGDLRHHPASEAQQTRLHGHGPALIDVSHFASEWFFLDTVGAVLAKKLPGVSVSVSEIVTDPWDFVVHPR